jgi:hypothetical protein
MRMQKVACVLISVMPSDAPEKTKPEDEARAREKDSETKETGAVRPSSEKIPEGGSDNLRRRADWFQKRTGQTP